MKQRGRQIAIITTAFVLVFLVVNSFINSNQISVFEIVFCLVISLLMWFLGTSYDRLSQRLRMAMEEKETLQNHKNIISQKLELYEQYFNSFDGATLYIYDASVQKTMYSMGVEQLFGFTQNELNQDHRMWKNCIHPEDVERVTMADVELFKGNPISVEFRIHHPQQGEKWILQIAKPHLNDKDEMIKINGTFIDITKQKSLENELRHMAYFDELTDLPNRQMLDRHIQKALARSRRHHHNLTLMFIDLDDFKIVNDTLGHDAGDKLLQETVSRLNESTREEDLIARIGGDEFIVVFEETSKEEIEEIAKRIIVNTTKPFYIDENEAKISLSIGVSMFPDDGEDKETLIQNADKAMYYAKNNGKNNYKLYTDDLNEVEVSNEGIFNKWLTMLSNTTKLFK